MKCWRLPKWFPLEDNRAIPLAQLYRWKENNFGQSIWDKRVVLVSREHLEEHINWELGDSFGNLMRTHWEPPKKHSTRGVLVTVWPCHLHSKSILRQKKKNDGNSNISPCKNTIFKKTPVRETKILQDHIITLV